MSEDRINLLICGHDLKFLRPFIVRCQNSPCYAVRILEHRGHTLKDKDAALAALGWADAIFCEWALGNAVWFSQHKRREQTLIVRLHLQEVQARQRTNFIWEMNWPNVNRLILITHHIYDWFCSHFPSVAPRCSLVYNPIPAKDALNLPKPDDSRFVLGMVGTVPARKRIDIAIALLRRLVEKDSRYVLHVKGALPSGYPWMRQRKDEMAWYDKVFSGIEYLTAAERLVFDPQGPDMPAWYSRVGHILSVSDFEGSHQAVAEGMAAGCVPAIRNWEGASRIYPPEYVAATMDELASLIHQNTEPSRFNQASSFCRQFARERFDQEMVCDRLEAILHHEVLQHSHFYSAKEISPACSGHRIHRTLPTFLIVAYIPIGSRNGYRIRVEQEIRILKQQGCIVHLACLAPKLNGAEMKSAREAHVEELSHLGCVVHLLEVENFFRLEVTSESFPALIRELTGIAKGAHVDIVHAEALYCARLVSLLKPALPTSTFSIDWHGILPEESRMNGEHQARILALEHAERRLLSECDLNVFVSHQMERHFRSKYELSSLRSVIVPCCISTANMVDFTQPVKEPVRDNRHLVFAYVGSMASWQCGEEMLALFAQLHAQEDACRFVLMVPEVEHQRVRKAATHFGLKEDAYSLKEVPHREVPSHLSKCHIGVLLRKDDVVNRVSSPTKCAEYLAAGLPVLLTDCVGDYSKMVQEKEVGLVIPSKTVTNQVYGSQILRQAIAFTDASKKRRKEIRALCQNTVLRELDWESTANRWIRAY